MRTTEKNFRLNLHYWTFFVFCKIVIQIPHFAVASFGMTALAVEGEGGCWSGHSPLQHPPSLTHKSPVIPNDSEESP